MAKNMVPKGYHKMPGGKLMKNSEMKHEMTESKKEQIKEYGKAKPKTKMEKVMREYKAGELNIGKSKKMVKSQKQAIAIGLSVSGMSKKNKKGGK